MVEPNVRPAFGPRVGHEILPLQTTSFATSLALSGRFRSRPPSAVRRKIRPVQHSPELERWILAELPRDTASVLDLGCGVGRTGFLLWEEGIGTERVGVELSPEYAARARGLGVYDRVDEADLSHGLSQFEDGAFDVVLCIDVLPHLEKSAGLRLVRECERVARRRVVLLVPIRKQPRCARVADGVGSRHVDARGPARARV